MSARSIATGRMTATFLDAFFVPRIRKDLPPVLYMHGAGGDATEGFGSGTSGVPSSGQLLSFLADEGFACACPTATLTWGNATSMTRMANAVTWLRSNAGASSAGPIVIGASMGALCALNYAAANTVSAVIGMIPLVDLTYFRDNNLLAQQASINTAHGTTGTNPLPAGADPNLNIAAYSGKAIQLWPSTDDDVSHNYSSFSTAVSADLHTVGALGHSGAAMAAANSATILSFIRSHL